MTSESDGLSFFNSLSGRLAVELTEPARPVSERIMNLQAPPEARVASLHLKLQVYERERRTFRELTDEEWGQVVLREPRLKMRGEGAVVVEHAAPDGCGFTVRDLAAVVEETERQGRDASEWLGGVDVHHVFFEGIALEEDGVWSICWGS